MHPVNWSEIPAWVIWILRNRLQYFEMTQRFYYTISWEPPIKCHLKDRKKRKARKEAGEAEKKERKQHKRKGEVNQQTGATENSKQEQKKEENQAC